MVYDATLSSRYIYVHTYIHTYIHALGHHPDSIIAPAAAPSAPAATSGTPPRCASCPADSYRHPSHPGHDQLCHGRCRIARRPRCHRSSRRTIASRHRLRCCHHRHRRRRRHPRRSTGGGSGAAGGGPRRTTDDVAVGAARARCRCWRW